MSRFCLWYRDFIYPDDTALYTSNLRQIYDRFDVLFPIMYRDSTMVNFAHAMAYFTFLLLPAKLNTEKLLLEHLLQKKLF